MEEKGEEIMNRVLNERSIHISRVPKRTKDDFVALAEEEFCGDYGMCLKALMDGVVNAKEEEMMAALQEHEERLSALEARANAQAKEERKTIRTLSGKEIVKGEQT